MDVTTSITQSRQPWSRHTRTFYVFGHLHSHAKKCECSVKILKLENAFLLTSIEHSLSVFEVWTALVFHMAKTISQNSLP